MKKCREKSRLFYIIQTLYYVIIPYILELVKHCRKERIWEIYTDMCV